MMILIKKYFLQNITVHPPNPAVSIEFRPTQLKSDVLHPAAVALISFNGEWRCLQFLNTIISGIGEFIVFDGNNIS